MAIGAYEQTVLDMTAAYSAVTNRGVYVKPTAFEEIRGPGGDVLWSRRLDGDRGKRAMDSDVADTMNWMLQRVVSGGTGVAAKLDDRPVAGKTGTSEGGAISGSSARFPNSLRPFGLVTTTTQKPRATVANPHGPGNNS